VDRIDNVIVDDDTTIFGEFLGRGGGLPPGTFWTKVFGGWGLGLDLWKSYQVRKLHHKWAVGFVRVLRGRRVFLGASWLEGSGGR
jgi:hypothetical protein